MTRRSQASNPNLQNSYANSDSRETLHIVLGQMLAHQQVHTTATHTTNELLHGVSQHLSSLPEQIALRLSKQQPPTPQQETKPSEPPSGKVIPLMKALKELIWSITPLAVLTAVVMGKLTWTDALPVIRQMLGLH